MPIWFRLVFYACLGVAAEVLFTAVCARLGFRLTADLDDPQARTSLRLKGHSFVWMFPIYAVGLLAFEVVHGALRAEPWLVRGLTYVAALYAVEYAAGALLVRLTGAHVWRWTGRANIGGHVDLAMAPFWLAAALGLEPVHDTLTPGSVGYSWSAQPGHPAIVATATWEPSDGTRPPRRLSYSSSSGSGPFGSETTGQFCRSWRSRLAIVATRTAFCGSPATFVSSYGSLRRS
jgi:hypothetical protein